MTMPAEAPRETDPIQALKDDLNRLLSDQSEKLAVRYEAGRPIMRCLGGFMSTEDQGGAVAVAIVSWDSKVDHSTTLYIGREQFVIDSSGVIRTDRHNEEPAEESTLATKLQQSIATGDAVWLKNLSEEQAAEIFAGYSTYNH